MSSVFQPPNPTAPTPPSAPPAGAPGSGRAAGVFRSPVTVEELTGQLLWPRLLRAPALALAPSRLALGSVLVVAVMLLDRVWSAVFGGRADADGGERMAGPLSGPLQDLGRPLGELVAAARSLDIGRFGEAMTALFITTPLGLVRADDGLLPPWGDLVSTMVLLPAALVLAALAGGAIARSAAWEFARAERLIWTRAAGFALARWSSLVGALAGPLALMWLAALGLYLAGWVMAVPGLDVLGSAVLPVLMLGGLAIALTMLAFFFGHPLVLPAVACDGADAFDAVQRAFAYVFARPIRLAGYLAVAIIQGVAAFLLLGGLAFVVLSVTRYTTGVPIELSGMTTPEPEGWTDRASAWLVGFWSATVRIAVAGYAVSLYFTAGTLVYLLMRRLVDGQDETQLWAGEGLSATAATAAGGAAAAVTRPGPDAPAPPASTSPPAPPASISPPAPASASAPASAAPAPGGTSDPRDEVNPT